MDVLHQLPFLSSLTSISIANVSSIVEPMMYSFSSVFVLASLALHSAFALPGGSPIKRDAEILKRSVDSFIATESPIALRNLLCNIGSTGACASGAASGIVVASPDRVDPNCESDASIFRSSTLLTPPKTFTLGLVILR